MSEVKMPVAAEEAEKIWQEFCDDPEVSIKRTIAGGIADIQRRTLLAAARSFYDDDDGVQYCQGCHRADCSHSPDCVVVRLERLAASLGEPGK